MKTLSLVILVLTLSVSTFATSVTFSNSGGTLAGSSTSTLSLTGSLLTGVDGLNGNGSVTGTNLGSVSFSTAGLMTGSLKMGGAFASGGSFTISGNGLNGVPDGVIFSGTFTSATWTLATVDGNHIYTFTGLVAGSMQGFKTTAMTEQFSVSTGTGFFNGSSGISPGHTLVAVVPEPASLCLLGIGLAALAGLSSRRISRTTRDVRSHLI